MPLEHLNVTGCKDLNQLWIIVKSCDWFVSSNLWFTWKLTNDYLNLFSWLLETYLVPSGATMRRQNQTPEAFAPIWCTFPVWRGQILLQMPMHMLAFHPCWPRCWRLFWLTDFLQCHWRLGCVILRVCMILRVCDFTSPGFECDFTQPSLGILAVFRRHSYSESCIS